MIKLLYHKGMGSGNWNDNEIVFKDEKELIDFMFKYPNYDFIRLTRTIEQTVYI